MPTRRRFYLAPFAALYGAVVGIRNWLYNSQTLKSRSYPIPIICVGNIAVGGTGKSPMVEYLVRSLKQSYRVAVVSRGYKRRSRGLVCAGRGKDASEEQIGDELKQLLLLHPDIMVVADGNRCRAVEYLLSMESDERPQVILMDDGMQHRRIKPSFTIMLTDYEHPFTEDALLPLGRLRETPKGRLRADCLIVTKCPEELSPIQKSLTKRNLSLFPHQRVFFTSILYKEPVPLFEDVAERTDKSPYQRISAIAGIASPEPFFRHLTERYECPVTPLSYPDHHRFTESDVRSWNNLADESATLFITTTKDAARLRSLRSVMSAKLVATFFVLPIEMRFLFGEEPHFQSLICQQLPRKSNTL